MKTSSVRKDVKYVGVRLSNDIIERLDAYCTKHNTHRNNIIESLVEKYIDTIKDLNPHKVDERKVTSIMSTYTHVKLSELLHNYNREHNLNLTEGEYIIQLIIAEHNKFVDNRKSTSSYKKLNCKTTNKKPIPITPTTKQYIDNKCLILKHNMKYFNNVIDNLSNAVEFKDCKYAPMIYDTINRANNSIDKFNSTLDEFVKTITKENK